MATKEAFDDLTTQVEALGKRVEALEGEVAGLRKGSRSDRGIAAAMGSKVRCPFCRRRMHPENAAFPGHDDKVEGGKACPGATLELAAPCSTCTVPAEKHADAPGNGCKAFKRFQGAETPA
jgi:hypothetical protein